ncbi:MAG: hypothetical protein AAF478_09110 [Pseudomonadota bacterium]
MPKILLKFVIGLILATFITYLALYPEHGDQETLVRANYKNIQEILSEEPEKISKQIDLENFEISLPLDNKGARILIRTEVGEGHKIPNSVIINHRSKNIEVMLEASETYEPYKAQ